MLQYCSHLNERTSHASSFTWTAFNLTHDSQSSTRQKRTEAAKQISMAEKAGHLEELIICILEKCLGHTTFGSSVWLRYVGTFGNGTKRNPNVSLSFHNCKSSSKLFASAVHEALPFGKRLQGLTEQVRLRGYPLSSDRCMLCSMFLFWMSRARPGWQQDQGPSQYSIDCHTQEERPTQRRFQEQSVTSVWRLPN